MANQSYNFKKGIGFKQVDLTTLTSPQDGDMARDLNDGGRLKQYNSSLSQWFLINELNPNQLISGSNSDFEGGIGSWMTYNDGASATPVDGTGGTVTNLTIAVTSNPVEVLSGAQSLKISKAAANIQGEGVSILSSDIGAGYQNGYLQLSLLTNATASAYGDIKVFAYDTTNSLLIAPLGDGVLVPVNTKQTFLFNISNAENVRIILHFATTSTAAYDVIIDDVELDNPEIVKVPIISDWYPYTLVIGATTSAPTQGAGATKTAYWRQNGGDIEIIFNYAQTNAGSAGTGTYLFPLPAGKTIDTSVVSVSTSANGAGGNVVGQGRVSTTTSTLTNYATNINVVPYNSSNLALYNLETATHFGSVGTLSYALNNNPIYYTFTAKLPCVQFASNTIQAISQAATLGICSAYSTATTNISSGASVTVDLTNIDGPDSLGMVDLTNDRIYAKKPGWYDIDFSVALSTAVSAAAARIIARIVLNGSTTLFEGGQPFANNIDNYGPGRSKKVFLNAGDYIQLVVENRDTVSHALRGGSSLTFVSVAEIPFSNTALLNQWVDLGTQTWADSEANSTTSVRVFKSGKFIKAIGITSVTGAFSGSAFQIDIPSSYTPDAGYYVLTNNKRYVLGEALCIDASPADGKTSNTYYDTSGKLSIYVLNTASTYGTFSNLTSTIPFTWANNDSITWQAEWMIA